MTVCPQSVIFALVALVSIGVGCRTGNDWQGRDARSVPLPDAYKLPGGEVALVTNEWSPFDSPELDRLMAVALTNNLGLVQAYERLVQSRAVSVQRGADHVPEISFSGSGSYARTGTAVGDASRTTESYRLGLGASYEIDLWGRVAAGVHEAERLEAAAAADLAAARLSLSAEVALRYFELMAVRAQIDVLREQIKTNRNMLELVELRFRRSQATALDVLQQRSLLAQSESVLPPLQSREEVLVNELTVLLGQVPTGGVTVAGRALPELPPQPTVGVPADLLLCRPDVAAAAERLVAAGWSAGAARADRLPTLRLTGDADYRSDSISALFDDWFAQLAAGLLGPILDGGSRKAEVERREAIARERLAAYRATVLAAVAEVSNALAREARQSEYLAALQRQLAAVTRTQEEAAARYLKGSESYLSVLNALTSRQQVERTVVGAKYDLIAQRIQLIRALGGAVVAPMAPDVEESSHE